MMPIPIQSEPTGFDQKVRKPGQRFLSKNPHPKSSDWKNKEFWREVLGDMYESYGGICAYCCEWMAQMTGDPTIDHFIPKSKKPQQAYEWSNFRLACRRFNTWKGHHEDVLDPFTIEENWFHLQFPSLQVVPNPEIPEEYKKEVTNTIKRLRLNDEICIESRTRWVFALAQEDISFGFIKSRAPFIAHELERQGYHDKVSEIIRISNQQVH
jgi:uncharacterized protein (TIGR02646 family)